MSLSLEATKPSLEPAGQTGLPGEWLEMMRTVRMGGWANVGVVTTDVPANTLDTQGVRHYRGSIYTSAREPGGLHLDTPIEGIDGEAARTLPMAEHLFRCPNGHLGRIDDDQLDGDVSIICEGNYDECDFHGYVEDGDVVETDYRPSDDT